MSLSQALALGCFWVSHLTFWVTLLMGFLLGTTDVCLPYLTGCTSISATGIPDPQAFVFRGGLIAACVLFVLWWYAMQSWLLQLAPQQPILTVRYMVAVGVFSSVCLIVATAVLRPDKANLPWAVHTIAAALFFLVSLAVQTRITHWLCYLQRGGVDIGNSLSLKFFLVYFQWFWVLVMIVLQVAGADDQWKNIVEWWLALLIGLYYLSSYGDWKDFHLLDT
jgi:hypothetical protein